MSREEALDCALACVKEQLLQDNSGLVCRHVKFVEWVKDGVFAIGIEPTGLKPFTVKYDIEQPPPHWMFREGGGDE